MNLNLKSIGKCFKEENKKNGYSYDFITKTETHLFFLLTKLLVIKESDIIDNKVKVLIDEPKNYSSVTIRVDEFKSFLGNLLTEEKKRLLL